MAQLQQQIEQLLQALLLPDTDKVNQATTALSQKPNTDTLVVLLQILTTTSKPDDIRQLAGVEARKRVQDAWPEVENKPAIRSKILEFAMTDNSKTLRHSAAQIIAEMGAYDLENSEWTDLPGKLLQGANSPQVMHREMGLYIMLSLIENSPEIFMNDIDKVIQALDSKIQDPESITVSLTALAIYAAIAPMIDPEENSDSITAIQEAVPKMVQVLKAAISSGEDDTAMQAFEAFQVLLGESTVFTKHLGDLVKFMLQILSNNDVDDDIRLQSVNFLYEAVATRKNKIQALKLGEELAMTAMQVVVQIDEFDEEGERNPATQCLALLDLLSANLPPNQVVLPVLKAVGQYATDSNPTIRRAGILALSVCVEGAPDFFSTQLKEIMPLVLTLLEDSAPIVRAAALKTVSRLADDLSEDIANLHESIIPAIIKNFDSAAQFIPSTTDKEQEDFKAILLDCAIAIDSMMDGMTPEDTNKYTDELVPRFSQLLSQDDYKMKICALSATGAIAESAEAGFLPYFKDTVNSFGVMMVAKDSDDDLEVRRATTEALGKIALAVGAVPFKDYVKPLMEASEEGLHLGNSGLKEQSYILWSQLSKVYGEEFEPFLDGVVKGLFESLEQDEASSLSDDAEHKIAQILSAMQQKKGSSVDDPGFKAQLDNLLGAGDSEEGIMIDDLEDLDNPVSAIAMEKEIVLEAVGDVLTHTKTKYLQYFPKTIEIVLKLVEHSYPGIQQSAIGTLWRAYAALWDIETERGMKKWEAGLPLKVQPSSDLKQLGDVVMKATLGIWPSQEDRTVVADINRMLGDTMTQCGPAPIAGENVITQICSELISIITKKHVCQMDPYDDDDDFGDNDGSAEYDWLVVDSAMDCLVALAKALGPAFSEVWKIFEKPVLKYASATDATERSVATGTMAECILAMGTLVTPYTQTLMNVSLRRFTDPDAITKGNAIYATGLLCQHSGDTDYIEKQYNTILGKLEPLLLDDTEGHLLDNAAGTVARMIMAHPDKVPVEEVLPRLIELTPAKEDWEVNGPIFQCIAKLYQDSNPTIRQQTPQVKAAIEKVLGEDEDHLDEKTRETVLALVEYLKGK
ncbi:ARM repeat-containing protein [Microthyrium microscopicum]|uniref:ARM repeat-containing protein n=1 Tax=Microthyrium microscopicum TaxID=703497 RepID=A0A6A6UG62_9PEZI|nr:ARM repeat-containing protein [Microthyrium microscopicum]